jgi:hypothetical protein
MSHFNVLVVLREGDDLHNKMAPYQENNMGDCPEQYLSFTDVTDNLRQDWEHMDVDQVKIPYVKLIDQDGTFQDKWVFAHSQELAEYKQAYLRDIQNERGVSEEERQEMIFRLSDEYREEIKRRMLADGFVFAKRKMSVAFPSFEEFAEQNSNWDDEQEAWGYWENSNARWDWYELGGRWTGHLKLKEGAPALDATSGEPGVLTEANTDPRKADMARVKDVDWEGMRKERAERAVAAYDGYWRILNKSQFKRLKNPRASKKLGRALWDAGYMFMDHDEMQTDRDEYIQRAAYEAVTFAMIDPSGGWIESATMGMFGVSYDPDDNYDRKFWDTIHMLDPDDFVAVVDCHI